MAMFKGFKPQGLQKIANSMGYTGSLEGFDSYLQQNPDKQNMMNMYNQRAMQMAQGGAVRKMAVGGVNQAGQFQSAMPTGNPADMEQFPTAELPPLKAVNPYQGPPKGSGKIGYAGLPPNGIAKPEVGGNMTPESERITALLGSTPNPSGIRPMYEYKYPGIIPEKRIEEPKDEATTSAKDEDAA